MGRTYTNANAMHKVPITVSFTCPKCNRAMTVEKFAVITGQAQMRGYDNPQAGVAAQSNLVSTAENQMYIDILTPFLKGQCLLLLKCQGEIKTRRGVF